MFMERENNNNPHGLTRRQLLGTLGVTTASLFFKKPIVAQVIEMERQDRFTKYHHPIVEGKKVPTVPYLSLPFKKTDFTESKNTSYDITEGWLYSQAEKSIHGFNHHVGIDFAVAYGTPLVAPTDGYAMSSYHTFWLKNNNNRIKTYQNKPLRFGLGNFIQIYIPEVNRFIQIGHLSDIDKNIPFSQPILHEDDWLPTNHTLTIQELINDPKVVKIARGQLLGRVGFSGLGWGYTDYQAGCDRPLILDPEKYSSWDEPHVHYEECYRDQTDGKKFAQRDPYGIYSIFSDYPTPVRQGVLSQEPLFFMDDNHLPQFA